MKQHIFIGTFLSILLFFSISYLVTKDEEVSFEDRRVLTTIHDVQNVSIWEEQFISEVEQYALDQIAGRDELRALKTRFAFDVLQQKDVHGLYEKEGHWFKKMGAYHEANTKRVNDKMKHIVSDYPSANAYSFLIPNKQYYMGETKAFHQMQDALQSPYIEDLQVHDLLDLNSYYKGDPHIKQDGYVNLLDDIVMKLQLQKKDDALHKSCDISFHGAYGAQSAYRSMKEPMCVYSSDTIEEAEVFYLDDKQQQRIYVREHALGMDPYSVFSNGPSSFMKIENKYDTDGKSLLMVRDSFASSLAPLLIPYYQTIYMVDLRYTSWDYIRDQVSDVDDIVFVYGQQSIMESHNMK